MYIPHKFSLQHLPLILIILLSATLIMRKKLIRHLAPLIFYVGALLILWQTWQLVNTSYANISYTMHGKAAVSSQFPILIPTEEDQFSVQALMHIPIFGSNKLIITPDDCLEKLNINNQTITNDRIPFCGNGVRSVVIDVSEYATQGWNALHAIITDNGGKAGFAIAYAHTNPVLIVFASLLVIVTIIYGYCKIAC